MSEKSSVNIFSVAESRPERCSPQIWALRRKSGQPYGDGRRRGRHPPKLVFPSLSLASELASVGSVSFLGRGGGLIWRIGARWPDSWQCNERDWGSPPTPPPHGSSRWLGTLGEGGQEQAYNYFVSFSNQRYLYKHYSISEMHNSEQEILHVPGSVLTSLPPRIFFASLALRIRVNVHMGTYCVCMHSHIYGS